MSKDQEVQPDIWAYSAQVSWVYYIGLEWAKPKKLDELDCTKEKELLGWAACMTKDTIFFLPCCYQKSLSCPSEFFQLHNRNQ